MNLTKAQLERILALYDSFGIHGTDIATIEAVVGQGCDGSIARTLRGYTLWINPPGVIVDPTARATDGTPSSSAPVPPRRPCAGIASAPRRSGPPTPARRPTAPCTADERARPVATTPGQIDVDQVLELVEREQEASTEAEMATGELVSACQPLVAAWAATLADRPQTQRTYGQAVRRFLVWLGPSLATSR